MQNLSLATMSGVLKGTPSTAVVLLTDGAAPEVRKNLAAATRDIPVEVYVGDVQRRRAFAGMCGVRRFPVALVYTDGRKVRRVRSFGSVPNLKGTIRTALNRNVAETVPSQAAEAPETAAAGTEVAKDGEEEEKAPASSPPV